jgi:hypothetical protein
MATEEGESSSRVTIPKTMELIEKAKDKDGDIKMTLDNNISLKRPVKVVPLPKFNGDSSKLEEYLDKVQIYINYTPNRFEKEHQKTSFVMSYLEGPAFEYLSIYCRDFIM